MHSHELDIHVLFAFFPIILVIFDFLYFLYNFVIDAIFQQICIVSIWKLLFAGDLGPLKARQIL